MKILSHLVIALCAVLFSMPSNAQRITDIDYDISTTAAVKIGHTKPVSELLITSATPAEKRALTKKNFSAPNNFIGRGHSKVKYPELEHQGPDPIRQWGNDRSALIGEIFFDVNVEGITSGSSPNDPTGDIGKDFYMQAVNATTIAVFDKNGIEVNRFFANSLWNSIGFTSAGDPIILYDQQVNRWIITEFTLISNQLLVAISDDSDPLGSYSAYNFATPRFPDYPKYAIWTNAISVTTNESGPGVLHNYFINRHDLLDTADQVRIQRIEVQGNNNTEAGFFTSTPIDLTGPNTPNQDMPMVAALNDASWGAVPEDAVDLYTFDINWNDSDSTEIIGERIITTPYDGFPCASNDGGFACIPQPDNGNGIDGLPELIMHNPHYRNFGTHESIVMNWVTDATDGQNLAAIRWMELRRTDTLNWEIHQEGTYAPDDQLHRFMAGICMDKFGNIAMAYNVSSEQEYVGLRATGRRVNDPLGVMTFDETIILKGEGLVTNNPVRPDRFGDYSHMTIDPIDDKTFWFTAEYAGANETKTRVVAFDLARDTIDLGALELRSPISQSLLTNQETIQFEVINAGVDTQQIFQVGYIFDGQPAVIENVDVILATDSTYVHTFSTPVNLAALRTYPIRLFTSLTDDQAVLNDTIDREVVHYPILDAGIIGFDDLQRVCGDTIESAIIISNHGTNTLSELTMALFNNEQIVDTIEWNGGLLFGMFDTIEFIIADVNLGFNTVSTSIISVNQQTDQISENDQFEANVVVLAGESIQVKITTDAFPNETTWNITTLSGNTIINGGPYQDENVEIVTELCLQPGRCYVFNIFDQYADGLEGIGNNPDGGYDIQDENGNTLASILQVNFGAQESNTFCLGIECMLDAEVITTNETEAGAGDGTILITPMNGNGDVTYSIDSGATFWPSGLFENLAAGTYQVVVKDVADCRYEEEVVIGTTTSIETLSDGTVDVLFPNPTSGVFTLELSAKNDSPIRLPFSILNSEGKVIQQQVVSRYDNVYRGMFSLYAYPDGIYYVRILDENTKGLIRIVKTAE